MLSYMLIDNHMPWEQELPREKVHLDLPSLPSAVVDNAVHPNGRRLRGAGWVYVGWGLSLFLAIPQLCVPDFVRYQKRLVKSRPLRLMKDEGNVRIKVGSTAIEQCTVWSAALYLDTEVFGYTNCEVIRDPRIAPAMYSLFV